MKYVIDFGPVPTLPVAGSSDVFPVGRIYCVGRNYAGHAREMGHDPDREPRTTNNEKRTTTLGANDATT